MTPFTSATSLNHRTASITMLNNATLARLRALKLQGFAGALQQQQDQADCLGLSFEKRLALLVEREVYARGDRKRTRLLQRAQLKYPTATLEDASFEGVRGIDRSALMSLALSFWIERGETITFAGATGLGKTWLACALAQYACRQGHSALYLRVSCLAEELRILHGAGSFRRWLQQLANVDVLVLDDWAPAPSTRPHAPTCSRSSTTAPPSARRSSPTSCPSSTGTRGSAIPPWPTRSSTGSCSTAGGSTSKGSRGAPGRPGVRRQNHTRR